MRPLKILLVSPEVIPFAKTGGLADVAGSLPLSLESLGTEVKVFLPYYRSIKTQDFDIQLLKKDLRAKLGKWEPTFSLYHCRRKKVDFYFIDKDEYYERDFLYGPPSGDYPDNAERFAFFANAVLSSCLALDFPPDIIQGNEWQSALLPFYLKFKIKNSNFFKNTKTLFTIHNLAYQGLFPREVMPEIGVDEEFFTFERLEFYGKFSFMKSGLLYSDAISTVSKGYAREILTPEFGCGLEGLLNLRQTHLFGILNGVDYSHWNPATDKFIKANYDELSLKNKIECKKDLLTRMKLNVPLEAPLLGVISRLAEQKGLDIIASSIEEIIKLGANLVILGTGDEKYHQLLMGLARRYPKHLALKIAFDNPLAHRIEAGCDLFLMPSRYEPCGLNQMYSLKYGTIPVVRAVGGLDDTVIDYTQARQSGNGFKFVQASPRDFLEALRRALSIYKNKREWNKLIQRAMKLNFSWEQSAKEYIKLYRFLKTKK